MYLACWLIPHLKSQILNLICICGRHVYIDNQRNPSHTRKLKWSSLLKFSTRSSIILPCFYPLQKAFLHHPCMRGYIFCHTILPANTSNLKTAMLLKFKILQRKTEKEPYFTEFWWQKQEGSRGCSLQIYRVEFFYAQLIHYDINLKYVSASDVVYDIACETSLSKTTCNI